MKASELITHLANMEIGATVEQDNTYHPKVLYHRVPGGWVVFSAGSAAMIPLNLDSINDLRINVGQKPLTKEEYATQNNAEHNAEHKAEIKEEKPKEPKPAPQMSHAAQQRAQKAAQNIIPDVMTPKPDSKPEGDGGPEPGK